jgi:hypothetical protein
MQRVPADGFYRTADAGIRVCGSGSSEDRQGSAILGGIGLGVQFDREKIPLNHDCVSPMKTQIKLYALGIIAYVFATMSVQMLNHFVIHKAHYEAVPFLRANPVFALCILWMLVQGTVLVFLFKRIRGTGSWYSDAIKYALMMGLFFSSYSILAEPAKYRVPSAFS